MWRDAPNHMLHAAAFYVFTDGEQQKFYCIEFFFFFNTAVLYCLFDQKLFNKIKLAVLRINF